MTAVASPLRPAASGQTATRAPATVHRPPPHDADQLRIFVRIKAGQTLVINTNRNLPISELKLIIQQQSCLPPKATRLIQNGRQLQESCTLRDHNITDGDTIHVTLSLRGGASPAQINKAMGKQRMSKKRDWVGRRIREQTQMDGTQFTSQKERGKERFAHFCADGLAGAETADILELTEAMKNLATHNLLAVDTRTNETTARRIRSVVGQGLESGFASTTDIKGACAKKKMPGGALAAFSKKMARRIGNDIGKVPSHYGDEGEGALWQATKFLGKKVDGVHRNLIIVQVYVPCPGEALYEHLKSTQGADPISALIEQVAGMLTKQVTAGTGVVLSGDFNADFTKKSDDAKRKAYKKEWQQRVLKPFGLENVQRKLHGREKDPRTYSQRTNKNKGSTWIDYVFASNNMLEEGAVTGIATLDAYGRTGKKGSGVLNSLHIPVIYELDVERWLNISLTKATVKINGNRRVLSAANKKMADKFEANMERMKITIGGEERTVEQAIKWAQDTEGQEDMLERMGTLATASDIMEQIGQEAARVEEELVPKGVREKEGKRSFKSIWTPGMVKRAYLIKKAERLLRARRVLGKQPMAIGRLLTAATRAAMVQEGIGVPKGEDEKTWEEWGQKTIRKLTEWRKAQHAKARKKEAKSMSRFKKQVEQQRKKGLTKKTVNTMMGRKATSELPTELTYYDEEGTHILTEPEEIKEFMASTTEEELGMGREHWWEDEQGREQQNHVLTRMDKEGDAAREIAQNGTEEERASMEETVPEHMRHAFRHMKQKSTEVEPAETLMTPQTLEEWNKKRGKKRANTANGKTGPSINHTKCFGSNVFNLCRLLANKGQALDMPLECFTEQLMYKIYKSNIRDAKKMRPLRFLHTIRKMQTSINKDRLMREIGRKGLIPKEQHAFCGGRSTVAPALWRRNILEDAMANKKNVLLADVDLSAGYDRIPPWVLDALLRRMGIDRRTRKYYLNMANMSTIEIITAFGLTRPIKAKAATLVQGCDTSCALWVALSDWSLACTGEASTEPYWYETGPGEGSEESQVVYADDSTYVQTTTRSMEGVLRAKQGFTQFTGQKVNATKSAVAIVQWSQEGELLRVPDADITIPLWQTKVEARDGDIKPNARSDSEGMVSRAGEKWETRVRGGMSFKWISAEEEVRHLGNTQSATGTNNATIAEIEKKAIAGCTALRRRLVGACAAEQLAKVVIQASAKYALALSNASVESMDNLQRRVKAMNAAKRGMAKTTRNEAFWASGIGMGWDKWSDVVNEEKLKIVHQAITKPNTMLGRMIQGAIYRNSKTINTKEHPLSREGLEHVPQKRQAPQWIDSLREYMGELEVEITAPTAQNRTGRTKEDFELASRGTAKQRMILLQQGREVWATDLLAEDGKTIAIGAPEDENEAWTNAAREILAANSKGQRETQIGRIERHSKGNFKWSMTEETLREHREDGATRKYKKIGEQRGEGERSEERRTRRRTEEEWWKPDGKWKKGEGAEEETVWVVVSRKKKMRGYHSKTKEWGAEYKGEEDAMCDICEDTERENREKDTKCYSCERRACGTHTAGEKRGEGWVLTTDGWDTAPVLTWMCEDCADDHTEAQEQRSQVKIIARTGIRARGNTLRAAAEEYTPEEPRDAEQEDAQEREQEREGDSEKEEGEEEGEEEGKEKEREERGEERTEGGNQNTQEENEQQARQGHTRTSTNQHTDHRLGEAKEKKRTLEIYSDGSKIHGAGSYAWIAGFWKQGNTWSEVANGAGWESEWDNRATVQTSTRMETMGVLRAADWATVKWNGPTKLRLDNKATITRFDKRYERVKEQDWKRPDNDLWRQMRKHGLNNWKLEWVKGHADKEKGHVLTKHETKNIVADKLADAIYENEEARETESSTVGPPTVGQIRIGGHVLTGNITKTLARMAKERRALKWMEKELQNHKAEHAENEAEQIASNIDMQLLREHATKLATHGKFTKYIKIVHSAVATNNVMVRRDRKESGLCPCCGEKPETLHHLMTECRELNETRNEMAKNIRDVITRNLGESEMDKTLIRAITKIWSKETMRHAAGRDESKAHRPKTSNMERVWEEIAAPEQIAWLKNITEGGARMLWDGRIHREFISGMRRFGATNGRAKKTAKELLEKITEHKIKLVDERHKIKHKETEKPRMAMEIIKLWKEADEANGKGVNSATGGAKQRMSLEELTKHLRDKSIKSIQEWIERLRLQETAARDKRKRRERSEKTKTNLGRVEEERAKQAAETKQKRTKRTQAITKWLKSQEEDEEQENDKADKQGGGGKRRRTSGKGEKGKETQTTQPTKTATPKRGPPTPPPPGGGRPAAKRGGGKRPRKTAARAVAGRRRAGGQKETEGRGRKRGGEKTGGEEERRTRRKSGEGGEKGRTRKGEEEGEEESMGEGGGEEVDEEEREAEEKGD